MLGIHCLRKNSPLIGNLTVLMQMTAYNRIKKGDSPAFKEVYRDMRKNGIEIDIQTAAVLYANTFDLSKDGYTSQDSLDKQSGKTYERLTNATHTVQKIRDIKGDSPQVAAAARVAETLAPRIGGDRSVQKKMEDGLVAWATRMLDIRKAAPPVKSGIEGLLEALMLDIQQPLNAPQPIGPLGLMAAAQEVQEDFKKELLRLAEVAGDPYQEALIKAHAEALSKAPNLLMISAHTADKAVREIMAEAGYTKTVDAKTGPKEVLDWNAIFKKDPNFRSVVKEVMGKKGLSPDQIKRIADSLESEYNNLIKTKKENKLSQLNDVFRRNRTPQQRTELDRLIELSNLGIFGSAQQDALLHLLRVSELDQADIRSVEEYIRITKMMDSVEITKWANTYLAELNRVLENIIANVEMRGSNAIKIVQYISVAEQISGTAILANFGNIAQNTVSGLMEWVQQGLLDPATAISTIDDFVAAFMDVATGGVRVGTEKLNPQDAIGNAENMYNLATAKTTEQYIFGVTTALGRATLSATDSGIKAALIRQHLQPLLIKMLAASNNISTGDAALIVNHALNSNTATLDTMAKSYVDIMKQLGGHGNMFTEKRVAQDLAMANLEAGGQLFDRAIQELVSSGAIKPTHYTGLTEAQIKAATAAAHKASSQGLGHESTYRFMQGTLDRMFSFSTRAVKNARQRRRSETQLPLSKNQRAGRVAGAIALGTALTKNVRFFGGSIRWIFLQAFRTTTIPLQIEIATRTGASILNRYGGYDISGAWEDLYIPQEKLKELMDSGNQKELERVLSAYKAGRAQFNRLTVGTVLSTAIGYGLILPYMLAKFGYDDDDPTTKNDAIEKLALWVNEDSGRTRLFKMAFPLLVHLYLRDQLKGEYTNVSIKSDKNRYLPSAIDVFNYGLATKSLAADWSTVAAARLIEGWQKEMKKEVPEYWRPNVEYIVGVANIGGPLIGLQVNKNTIKTLNGIDITPTDWQREELEADNWWEQALRSGAGQDIYTSITNRDMERPAPVSDKVVKDYERTGNDDFLPPVPTGAHSVTEGDLKYKFLFDTKLQGEWIQAHKDAYLKVTQQRIEVIKGWDNIPDDSKIDQLKGYYDEMKEMIRDKWQLKYPLSDPRYWEVEKKK